MEKEVVDFLSVLFDADEEVCVSTNKYGYSSVSLQEVLDKDVVQLTSLESAIVEVPTDEIKMIAINPIKGQRNDQNVTAMRNFLIEMDNGDMNDQLSYIKSMEIPYSAAVFSGSKSIHFAVCLEESLPSLDVYNFYASWMLAVLSEADQQTKNPSRSIRFPNNYRDGVKQKLLSVRQRISLDHLKNWLSRYPESMPKMRQKVAAKDFYDFNHVPRWLKKQLIKGIDFTKGRNNTWFKFGLGLGNSGCDEDMALAILEPYFEEEYDFKRHEWEASVKSGVKKARS